MINYFSSLFFFKSSITAFSFLIFIEKWQMKQLACIRK